jgi:signal transduction histidine kinase
MNLMNLESAARAALLRLGRLMSAAALLVPDAAWAQGFAGGATSLLSVAMGIALACAALALVVGAWWALRLVRTQRQLTGALRIARARADCIEPLLDGWLWQTDRTHRLIGLKPPAGAAAEAWSATVAPAASLFDAFIAVEASALRARVEAAAPLDAIGAGLAAAGTPPRAGMLHGRAYTDAAGAFAGYHGSFRETAALALVEGAAVDTPIEPAGAARRAPVSSDEHESFSFTVSHDLRAPIRVVEGFTKIVKEDYGRLLDRVGNDHLDRVLAAAARMNNMIDALLGLAKLSSQPLAHQPVNLSQLAGFVVDDLRRQWPQRVVTVEIAPDMEVLGDPTLLRTAIENLLGNAWKYTAKTAEAQLTFTRHALTADTFTVRDNGAGFDMRFAERLFGVFQRLHSANDFPGTGVGLASVRRIVRRHGGEIWAEAEVQHGARFHFSLP